MKKRIKILCIIYLLASLSLSAQVSVQDKIEQYQFSNEYSKITPNDIIYRHFKKTGSKELLKNFLELNTNFAVEVENAKRDATLLNKETPTSLQSLVVKGELSNNISDQNYGYKYYWRKDYGFRINESYDNEEFVISVSNIGGWKLVPTGLNGTNEPERFTEREEGNIKKIYSSFNYPELFGIKPDMETYNFKLKGVDVINQIDKKYYCYKLINEKTKEQYFFDIEDKVLRGKIVNNTSVLLGKLYKSRFVYEDWKYSCGGKVYLPSVTSEQIIDGSVTYIYTINNVQCDVADVEALIDHPDDVEKNKEERENLKNLKDKKENFEDEYEDPTDDIFDLYDNF